MVKNVVDIVEEFKQFLAQKWPNVNWKIEVRGVPPNCHVKKWWPLYMKSINPPPFVVGIALAYCDGKYARIGFAVARSH